jgi:hypothetical protein
MAGSEAGPTPAEARPPSDFYLERDPEKWIPVFRKIARQIKETRP